MTMITGADNLHQFALIQAAFRLALEINTGLGFKESTLAACQRAGLTSKRTKKGALEDLVDLIREAKGDHEWLPESIGKALA